MDRTNDDGRHRETGSTGHGAQVSTEGTGGAPHRSIPAGDSSSPSPDAEAEALIERHDNWAKLPPKTLALHKKHAAHFKRSIWWTVQGCPLVYKTRGAALEMARHIVQTKRELAASRAA